MNRWQVAGMLILAVLAMAVLHLIDQTAIISLLAPLAGLASGEGLIRGVKQNEPKASEPPVLPPPPPPLPPK